MKKTLLIQNTKITFSFTDLPNCLKCPGQAWSLRGWKKCRQRTESFLKWDNPFAISLLVVRDRTFVAIFHICHLPE